MKLENKKNKRLEKEKRKIQAEYEIKERKLALKHKEEIEKILQNNVKLLDEKLNQQQNRLDELDRNSTKRTRTERDSPKRKIKIRVNTPETKHRTMDSDDIMNDDTRVCKDAIDTDDDNEKIIIHGLNKDIGELRRSIQRLDGEHALNATDSPTETSTPIIQSQTQKENTQGDRTTKWISEQRKRQEYGEFSGDNPQPSTSQTRDIRERLDFSRRIQPEDARQRLLEIKVRDKDQEEDQMERAIKASVIEKNKEERQASHTIPTTDRSPPRSMERERERYNSPDRYQHTSRRYISTEERQSSHQKRGWSPSPPRMLSSTRSRISPFTDRYRHRSPDRFPYRSPYQAPYRSPPHQSYRRPSPQDSYRDREEDEEYEYERGRTGYGRGSGYDRYRR